MEKPKLIEKCGINEWRHLAKNRAGVCRVYREYIYFTAKASKDMGVMKFAVSDTSGG